MTGVVQAKGKIVYRVAFRNEDYGNIARKMRKDNLIKQKKDKAKISVQLDKDLRDYCDTNDTTMSSTVRDQFKIILEDDYY